VLVHGVTETAPRPVGKGPEVLTVSAQGNQVQAETDLEDARLSLEHEQGTLLRAFQVDFHLQDPHRTHWYSQF